VGISRKCALFLTHVQPGSNTAAPSSAHVRQTLLFCAGQGQPPLPRAVCQSPQRSADRSTRRPRRRCHGERRPRRGAPALAGVPGSIIEIWGSAPNPPGNRCAPSGAAQATRVGARDGKPSVLRCLLIQAGRSIPLSAPSLGLRLTLFVLTLPPLMLATLRQGGLYRVKAKPCGGRANTARGRLDTRPPYRI
jgi:hypothetical protein